MVAAAEITCSCPLRAARLPAQLCTMAHRGGPNRSNRAAQQARPHPAMQQPGTTMPTFFPKENGTYRYLHAKGRKRQLSPLEDLGWLRQMQANAVSRVDGEQNRSSPPTESCA